MWPSDPRTGKGFLIECILQPLLLHTEVAASYSKGNGPIFYNIGKELPCLADDCKTSSDATQTKLKSILSEERQHVERKQAQGKMVRRYTRFILASNEARPLYLDADERRWLVFDRLVHHIDGAETQQFISRLYDWIKTEGALDKVYNWFMKYDFAGFNQKRAPESKALHEMVAPSVNTHQEFTASFITDNIVFTLKEEFGAKADFYHPGLELYIEIKDCHLNGKTSKANAEKADSRIDPDRLRKAPKYHQIQNQWNHAAPKQAIVQSTIGSPQFAVVFTGKPDIKTLGGIEKQGIQALSLSRFAGILRLQAEFG